MEMKIKKEKNSIEWIGKNGFPFFRAFTKDDAIPFIHNEEEKGRIILGCVFKESVPEGYQLKIVNDYIFLEKID